MKTLKFKVPTPKSEQIKKAFDFWLLSSLFPLLASAFLIKQIIKF